MKVAKHPRLSADLPEPHRALRSIPFYPGERLEAYRLFYEAGVDLALHDALRLCQDLWEGDDVAHIPNWALEGALISVRQMIGAPHGSGTGRHANLAARSRDNQRHIMRYLLVRNAMAEGHKLDDAYELVSDILASRNDNIKADGVRSSYKKTQAALKDPAKALEFYPMAWPRWAPSKGKQ